MLPTLALISALMLALIPEAGAAQSNAAPEATASPGLSPPTMPMTPEVIQQHIAQMQRFAAEQQAFRSQLIGALTPAHRALLAHLVGDLAIAPAPDLEGAARQLNVALSSGEAQAVTRVEQARESAALQQMQTFAAESGAPQNFLGAARPPAGARHAYGSVPFGSDAGSILLRAAAMGLMQSRIQMLPLRLPVLQPQSPAR